MKRALLFGAALAALAQPAAAETDLFSGDQLRGFLDVRAGAADGEASWLDDGFGKLRFGGDDGDWNAGLDGHAAFVWRPHLTWTLDGYLHLQAGPYQDFAADAVEAYFSYRAPPRDGLRLSGRAGLMYPPISLEHDGPAWTVTRTLTPSASNSWIGEEVKVLGVEATARRRFGEQEGAATLGLFGFNDTSGTLIAYRGWALHDVLPGAFGNFPLPRRGPAWTTLKAAQAPYTEPTRELDDRIGYYARLEYKPSGPVTLHAFHYDNAGDRRGYQDGQWSWETRFTDIGVRAALGENTLLLAQAMSGQTIYGWRTPIGYWVDVDYNAGYVLLSHTLGENILTGRVDLFETIDRSGRIPDNNDEEGWAATAAFMIPLNERVTLALEGVHVQSERPARADQGLAPELEQTMLQSALQLVF